MQLDVMQVLATRVLRVAQMCRKVGNTLQLGTSGPATHSHATKN